MELQQTLPPAAPSVGRARRLIAEALRGGRHEERLDEILLLVSEIMTNAVLHAGTSIGLTLHVEDEGVRVEVVDGSSVLPVQRDYDRDASTGRGLGLVALLADEHGVEPLPGGKSVWFLVEGRSPVSAEADVPPGELPGAGDWEGVTGGRPAERRQQIRLLGVPVHLFRAMRQHDDALLREHALIELDGHAYRPLRVPVDLHPVEEALRRASEKGRGYVDVAVPASADAAEGARALLDVLASADQQAFEGAMLTPSALPEVRWCRLWHLEQIAGQLAGADPRPWTPLDVHHRLAEVAAEADREAVLEALPDAVVAGNAQNRVVYVNSAAEALLGCDRDALIGKRVTALLPERLRDRYLAAFTDHLVTGSVSLDETPLVLPVLRADGSEVDVEITLAAEPRGNGAPLFVACLRRPPAAQVAKR